MFEVASARVLNAPPRASQNARRHHAGLVISQSVER